MCADMLQLPALPLQRIDLYEAQVSCGITKMLCHRHSKS